MTLSKRAAVAIFPVILLGYALAAATTYQNHKVSLIGFDRAKLIEQIYKLQSTFTAYKAFDLGLLNVIRDSNALLLFMHETDDGYRSDALGIGLQDSVQSMSSGSVEFVSCAIFRPDHALAYYYDSSHDPFAGLSALQLSFAKQTFSGTTTTAPAYLTQTSNGSLIVTAGFVSGPIAAEPLPSQKKSAFLIQIAVRPVEFEALKARLEAEYDARIELSNTPLKAGPGISQVFKLEPGLYGRLTPPPSYLNRPLRHAATVAATSSLVMSMISIGMLLLLVQRYIIGPVETLDRQVMEVVAGRREIIEARSNKDEVGRLSTNVQTLHTRGCESLREINTLYCTDALTGISNRAHFNMLSERMLNSVLQAEDDLTLLFIDLDNFKFVNDRYGHAAGDAVLKEVAQRISSILKQVADAVGDRPGTCARLSGDEFALLIRSHCRSPHVSAVIMAIQDTFRNGFQLSSQRYPVTPSIGVASVPFDARTVSQLISCADAAMYKAKETGRNAFVHFSEDLVEPTRRRRLVEECLRTLDRDREFSLVYMPIVNRSGAIIACEALLRWSSPILGEVSPDEFIPIAESTGLFANVDDWVIDNAMAAYSDLASLFGNDLILGINLSSAQLYTQSLAVRIGSLASKYGLSSTRVELELTETFAAGFNEDCRRAVESLRLEGFRIAIDDFGVGYTSIQQIIEYPVDTIKLDRMIIDRLATSPNLDRLRSLIAFCHASNINVVAEGVDTAVKAQILADAHCDGFQGFGISPPLTVDALAVWHSRLSTGLAPPLDDGVFKLAVAEEHRKRRREALVLLTD